MSNEFETNLLGRRARVHHKYSSGDDTVACIEGEIVGVKLDGGDIAVYIENEADGFVGYYDRRGFRLIRNSQGDAAEAKSRVADELGEMHTADAAIALAEHIHILAARKEVSNVRKMVKALGCGNKTYYAALAYATAKVWVAQSARGNLTLTDEGKRFLNERAAAAESDTPALTLDEAVASE